MNQYLLKNVPDNIWEEAQGIASRRYSTMRGIIIMALELYIEDARIKSQPPSEDKSPPHEEPKPESKPEPDDDENNHYDPNDDPEEDEPEPPGPGDPF